MTEPNSRRLSPNTTAGHGSVAPADRAPVPVLRLVSPTDGRDLTDTLLAEDTAQSTGLSPFERLTCPFHRRWAYQCVSSPVHVIRMTGHRWCSDCQASANVSVDELTGRVSVKCSRCGRPPQSAATAQIVRTCQASLTSARGAPPVSSAQSRHLVNNHDPRGDSPLKARRVG